MFLSLEEETTLWKLTHDCLTQWLLPVLLIADMKIRHCLFMFSGRMTFDLSVVTWNIMSVALALNNTYVQWAYIIAHILLYYISGQTVSRGQFESVSGQLLAFWG